MLVRADGRFPVGSLAWETRGGAHALTVVCTVTHVLAPDRSPLAEEQPPPRDVDSTWNGDGTGSLWAPGDLVPRKGRVDVLVGGHAYSAGEEAVTSLVVRLVVGSLNKALVVRGDRVWTAHDRLTAAAPFTSMPLRWELAAGGPGTSNPVGVPPDPPADANGLRPVPNLLPPRAVVLSPGQEIPPVGLGPLAPSWPDRASRAGRYASVFSHAGQIVGPLPEDLDVACFNAAPPDQQVDSVGALLPIVLENLHVEHAMLLTEVPAEAPTAFVRRAGGAIEELRLVCDTIWIDSYRGTCTLTYRGVVALRHREEEGVVVVMEPGVALPRGIDPSPRRDPEALPRADAAPLFGQAAWAEPAVESSVELLAEDEILAEGDEADDDAAAAAEDDGSETTVVAPAATAAAAEDDGSETTVVAPAAAAAAVAAAEVDGGDVDWSETTMAGPAPGRGEGLFTALPAAGGGEGVFTAPPGAGGGEGLFTALPVAGGGEGVFTAPAAGVSGLPVPVAKLPVVPVSSAGAFAPPPALTGPLPGAGAPVGASDEEGPRRPMTLVLGQGTLAGVKLGAARRGFFENENRTHTSITPLTDDAKKALPFEAAAPAPGPPPRSALRFEGEDSTRTIDLEMLGRAAAAVPFKEGPKFQRAWTMEVTLGANPALPFARAETAVPAVPAQGGASALPFQGAEQVFERGKTWLPVPSAPVLPFQVPGDAAPVLPFQVPRDVAPAGPGASIDSRVPFAGGVIEPAVTGMFVASPELGASSTPQIGDEPLVAQVIAPAAPPEAPPLSVVEYTEIKVEIWLGGGLAEVLGRRGIDEVEWRAEERRQVERLAAETSEGKCELALALADALREARARARQPGIVVAPDTGASVAAESG